MKDFHDVWRLSRQFDFEPEVLCEAVRKTLEHRGTGLIPFNELKASLLGNDMVEKQWTAFLAKSGVAGPESFHEVLDQLTSFLGPLFERVDHYQ